MAVPGAPYPAVVLALLPHYRLAPGFATHDQQDPTGAEIGQYHADVNDWRLELTAQLLVIAPRFHTNAQWPAGLPAAANQAARLAKVAEIDNFIGGFMPEYSQEYGRYGQAMKALIPAVAPAAGTPAAAAVAPAATAVVPAAALAPGGGQIGPPPGAPPPPWHHLYMAGQQYVGPPPAWAPGALPLPVIQAAPPQPYPAVARNPKPECPEFFEGKSAASARHFIHACQNYMVIAPFIDPQSEIRWAL
jgi:hypothetical protein